MKFSENKVTPYQILKAKVAVDHIRMFTFETNALVSEQRRVSKSPPAETISPRIES